MVSVYTRYLTTADYGTMELLDVTANFIGAVLGSRFGDALTNSYFSHETDTERRRVVSTGFLGMLCLGFALAASSFYFSDPLSMLVFGNVDYARYFHLSFMTLGASLPSEAAFAYIRALNRSTLFTSLQVMRIFIMLGLNVLFLVGLGFGLVGILYSALIGMLIGLVVLAVFVFSRCGVHFDASIFRRQLKFSLPLVMNPAGMIFVHYGDRFFLKSAVSLSEIGIYALAYKVGMLVSYLVNPVMSYWRSQMYEIMKTGSDHIYPRLSTYLVLFLVSLGLGFSLFARAAVDLLAGSAFHRAAVLVPLVSAGYVMLNASEFFRSVLLLAGKPGREARIMFVGTVFCIAAYATMIPRWKLWGAAGASASTFAVLLIYGFVKAQKVRHVNLEVGRLVRIMIAALISFAVYTVLPRYGFSVEALEASGCALLYVVVLWASGFVEPEEWDHLRQIAARVLPRARTQTAGSLK